jgi:serine/threonine protein kinase
MAVTEPRLTCQAFRDLPRQLLHAARHWSKADIYLAEWPPDSGSRVIIKDFSRRPRWFRTLIARHLLQREWHALQALEGIEGVPHAVARPDAHVLVQTYCGGQSARDISCSKLPPGVIARLEAIITQVHSRGVTNGDLHLNNVLIDKTGGVTLIDWSTASCFGCRRRGFKAWTFVEWCALDYRAIIKLKVLNAPHLVTPAEGAVLVHGQTPLYRAVKRLRRLADAVRRRRREPTIALQYRQYLQQHDLERDR